MTRLTFLADQNFSGVVVRGVRRREVTVDILPIQQTTADGAADPLVLAFAAEQGRVLLTHDASTMPDFAYDRIAAGLPMPGVIIVPGLLAIGRAVYDLHLVAACMTPDELADRIIRLPL